MNNIPTAVTAVRIRGFAWGIQRDGDGAMMLDGWGKTWQNGESSAQRVTARINRGSYPAALVTFPNDESRSL